MSGTSPWLNITSCHIAHSVRYLQYPTGSDYVDGEYDPSLTQRAWRRALSSVVDPESFTAKVGWDAARMGARVSRQQYGGQPFE